MSSSKFTTFAHKNQNTPTLFGTLRLRLTALCLGVTCLIITVLTILCLFISESGMRRQEYLFFTGNLNTLYQDLERQSTLSHQWIRQMEYNYQLYLRVTDNGKPLFFESLSDANTAAADTLRTLFELAADDAASLYHINPLSADASGSLTRHVEFSIEGPGKNRYYASAAVLPRTKGSIGVVALHPHQPLQARIMRQRLLFFLADLVSAALLAIFFWRFTARMLHPLAENRKRQMQFVASASHELRSPLTVILTNTAAVKNGALPNDAQFLETVESEGQRMARLITDMLQLANADSQSWSIRPAAAELDTLLLQVWEAYEPQAAALRLGWDIQLPDDAVAPCICDAERIRQLLGILIDNAFSYTPAHGHVWLSLTCTGTDFTIAVSDNGPGVPDAQKESVFERFYRADPARKSKSHFGLGLCIAREIARLHHGQLLLHDTPGGGATFLLRLPK